MRALLAHTPGCLYLAGLTINEPFYSHMTQALWYLRHAGKVYGPFPAPQISDALRGEEIDTHWEISLNAVDWMDIGECEQFKAEQADGRDDADAANPAWREERKKARERWLGHDLDTSDIAPLDSATDAQLRQAVLRNHERTEALVEAARGARPPLAILLLALVLLAVVGVSIWFGQRDQPIQAGIGLAVAPDCTAPLASGVNWRGCDRRGLSAAGVVAPNAMLEGARLDDARLAGSDLSYAVLRGASLRNVDFRQANLTGADLRGADLGGADFTGADLRHAILRDARLIGTRLDGAQLARATWLDGRDCASGSIGICQ